MKRCPYCAEEIQTNAIKCRFCGEFLKQTDTVSPSIHLVLDTATDPEVHIDRWYYEDYGEKGPVLLDKIRQLYQNGSINDNTLIWTDSIIIKKWSPEEVQCYREQHWGEYLYDIVAKNKLPLCDWPIFECVVAQKSVEEIDSASLRKIAQSVLEQAIKRANKELLEIFRTLTNSKLVCPHCNVRGSVTTKSVKRKKGISGAKATGAVLSLGWSLLATGLSRKEEETEAHCYVCGSTWHY